MKRKAISLLLAMVMLTMAAGVFAKQDKVTICHKPGTEDEETLSVAAPAVAAHFGHGDDEGACVPACEAATVSGTLTGEASGQYDVSLVVPPYVAIDIFSNNVTPGGSFTWTVPATPPFGSVSYALPAQFYVQAVNLNQFPTLLFSNLFEVGCGENVTGILVDRLSSPVP